MKGIHPSIASHRLNVFSTARPVRQKIRRFHPERQRVIRNEVDKLLEAGFIREVSYPDWLANVVVVPKKEGKWRVCVDYTNLNNVCPKDSFPLPRIDQIVDSTSGQGMLSFLDAFSGYHQIPMSLDDEEKTAFITPHGLYCYKVMSFGLKNASTTYQRLMTKIFKPLIGHSVEVYIDDIVLNPSKCAFGVSAGKFLRFMVSQRGIEVSPDQVKAVMETPPPRNKKELQRLTGKLVALGRFIARFTDQLRPFFLAIRKAGAHRWRTVAKRFGKN
ncbi:Transposon Ty3-I Gag-Pol polyprotein [Vitis vinifera]|uniref:Transposon Ty3-I Gag-Pol polyprotein n=1 Tax=Vitis vinifera TaxID=29760 RepID=A0A438GWU2_VITVI|nr:Transposon Ty3-I Gag-Pol polyprotein [Vitis vinifera]